ncbi:type IV pilus secretin PilQ [Idiomarina fontislapidosi]|uniref:type IV pilus secretin PilQ n=1 Tax=Idiomarina fontislapidosi TaxID=263723 RepID=UPI001F544858|nr:type IV pilus secretin PilQ [Idiomarina fontislapidosi]
MLIYTLCFLLPTIATASDKPNITLTLKDVDLVTAFEIIADKIELNLIADKAIQETVSLSVSDVDALELLHQLAESYGLTIRMNNNLVRVTRATSTQSEVEATQQAALPHLIPLNHAKAEDIAQLLSENEQRLLSKQGAVSIDARTNTLILKESPAYMEGIKQLIAQLDVPVKQVMIEARMVTMKSNAIEQFGVRWGDLTTLREAGNSTQIIEGMRVDLPSVPAAGRFKVNVGKLSDGLLLDLELSAMEQDNQADIIAKPKIFTSNQQPAYIEQGTEIPYVESAASGATAVKFKKAVMGLRVTPQITSNDYVMLDLTITQNTRGDTVSTPTGPAVAIDTQEMATRVLVKSGETIVLGGIFQQYELKDDTSVPILSSLPLVGNLFKNQREQSEKRELVIFVTPTLLSESE